MIYKEEIYLDLLLSEIDSDNNKIFVNHPLNEFTFVVSNIYYGSLISNDHVIVSFKVYENNMNNRIKEGSINESLDENLGND